MHRYIQQYTGLYILYLANHAHAYTLTQLHADNTHACIHACVHVCNCVYSLLVQIHAKASVSLNDARLGTHAKQNQKQPTNTDSRN